MNTGQGVDSLQGTFGPTLDWRLVAAIASLLLVGVAAAHLARLRTGLASLNAGARAAVQLLAVAAVITLVLEHTWSALMFVGVMLLAATVTAGGRVGARSMWPWIAVALLAGAGPVLAIVFVSGTAPFRPATIVSICGIVIGGTMTSFVLAVRRAFSALRERTGLVEAALALGFKRRAAIALVIEPDRSEALLPIFDQTRTVGLVTLPGAFVGVLLGGGSPRDAAAAQILVLIGQLTAQTLTVVTASFLVSDGRLLPNNLRSRLPAS